MNTHNSWLSFPWINLESDIRTRQLSVAIPDCQKLSVTESVRHTLRVIAQEYANHKLMMLHSGGIRSEVIFSEAQSMGIDIEPIFLIMHDDLNGRDYSEVQRQDIKFNRTDSTTENPSTQKAWLRIPQWLNTQNTLPSWRDLSQDHGFMDVTQGMLVWARHRIQERYGDDVCVIQGWGGLPVYRLGNPDQAGTQKSVISYSWSWDLSMGDYFSKYFPCDVPHFYTYTPEIVHGVITSSIQISNKISSTPTDFPEKSVRRVLLENFDYINAREHLTGTELFEDRSITVPDFSECTDYEPYTYYDYHEFIQLF